MLIIKKPAVPADVRYEVNHLKVIEQQNNDMTAHKNISKGEYFAVGTRIFKALRSIPNKTQMVVGVDCEEINVADALNQLNQ